MASIFRSRLGEGLLALKAVSYALAKSISPAIMVSGTPHKTCTDGTTRLIKSLSMISSWRRVNVWMSSIEAAKGSASSLFPPTIIISSSKINQSKAILNFLTACGLCTLWSPYQTQRLWSKTSTINLLSCPVRYFANIIHKNKSTRNLPSYFNIKKISLEYLMLSISITASDSDTKFQKTYKADTISLSFLISRTTPDILGICISKNINDWSTKSPEVQIVTTLSRKCGASECSNSTMKEDLKFLENPRVLNALRANILPQMAATLF